ANLLYEFIWHEFCDWYLEIIKDRFTEKNVQIIVYKVLEKSLRLLHPTMPFITEEIWQILSPQTGSIMVQPWPHLQKQMIDKKTEEKIRLLMDLVTSVRKVRSEWHIEPVKKIEVLLRAPDAGIRKLIEENLGLLKVLIRAEKVTVEAVLSRPEKSVAGVVGKIDFFLPLSEVVDFEREKARLKSQIEQYEKLLKGLKARLKNKEFIKKAPKEVVEKERLKEEEFSENINRIRRVLKQLE
ncbi:MAG: class I tRNA ligase family protein, partial [Candidatus Omnitrophota bacterium]